MELCYSRTSGTTQAKNPSQSPARQWENTFAMCSLLAYLGVAVVVTTSVLLVVVVLVMLLDGLGSR